MTNVREEVPTVARIDLERYLGTWFEICRLPLKWEDANAQDITATYALNENGTISVDNRCIDKNGKPDQAIGLATAIDATNAKLKLSFLPPYLRWIPFTTGDYRVLRISPDYDVALIGTPSRENLWLLSRTAHLPDEIRAAYLATARHIGYDLSTLVTPFQSGLKVEIPDPTQ